MAAVVVGFNSHSKRNPIHLGGDTYQVVGEITTDGGDYASGGFALTASLFGLDYIDAVLVGHSSSAGITGRYVQSTGKVLVYDEDNTSGVEAEYAAAAISASFPVIVTGRLEE